MYRRNSFEVYIVLIYIYFQIVQPSVRLNKKPHRWKIEKVETYNGKETPLLKYIYPYDFFLPAEIKNENGQRGKGNY